MTKAELYNKHLIDIALSGGRHNRFRPEVYWTPGDEPLEFGVVDTETPNVDGDPALVAIPFTIREAIEVASSWSLVPERAGNDWADLIG